MIAFISIIYSLFYILFFNKLKLFKKTARNISVFVGVGVVLIGTIVFMWLTFAPTSPDARLMRYIIPIVPNVSGQVVEVPVEPLMPLKKGDVLYKIDPTPYQYSVDQLKASINQGKAQQRLAEIQVERSRGLVRATAGAQAELDRWQAELASAKAGIASLEAQLGNAQWRLDETVVRAPHDGRVVNLQLRPGNFVTNMPIAAAMTFVSDEISEIVASFSQSAIRRIKVGDKTEAVLTTRPGEVYSGTVTHVVELSAQAQLTASGQLPTLTGAPATDRWAVRVVLDEPEVAAALPQGAGGMLAVYTDAGKPFHIITKVVVRMQAWMGYLTSP